MSDVVLTFTDVDGEENGGDFETEDVQVPLTQTDPGDGVDALTLFHLSLSAIHYYALKRDSRAVFDTI